MTGNLAGFNAAEVELNEGFTPLPAGEYPMIIIESSVKPTKEGNGQVAEIQTQIMGGAHHNRKFKTWIVLFNKNGEKNEIGQVVMASICRAVNILSPKDTSELHSEPFIGVVAVKKDQNGNPQNKVTKAKPLHTGPNMIEQAFEPTGDEPVKSPF